MNQLNKSSDSLRSEKKLRHDLSTIEAALKSSLSLTKRDSQNQAALELADQAVERLSIIIRNLDEQIGGADEHRKDV